VEVANRAVDVFERENRVREEIRRGGTLSSVQELESGSRSVERWFSFSANQAHALSMTSRMSGPDVPPLQPARSFAPLRRQLFHR